MKDVDAVIGENRLGKKMFVGGGTDRQTLRKSHEWRQDIDATSVYPEMQFDSFVIVREVFSGDVKMQTMIKLSFIGGDINSGFRLQCSHQPERYRAII